MAHADPNARREYQRQYKRKKRAEAREAAADRACAPEPSTPAVSIPEPPEGSCRSINQMQAWAEYALQTVAADTYSTGCTRARTVATVLREMRELHAAGEFGERLEVIEAAMQIRRAKR